MTYTVHEYGRNWIVRDEAGMEVARYRKDEFAWHGYADIAELKRELRSDLHLKRSDRITVQS